MTPVAIVCVAALCLAGSISGRWQAGPPGDLEIVWSKQQPHPLHYLEEKAALSPDGTAVAYVTPNGDLILADIPSGEETVLVTRRTGGHGMPHPSFAHDVSEPSFSLDGKWIVFRRHDGASGCASSDIYAVDTDGQNLVQLTHAASISQELAKLNRRLTPRCDRSYRQPRYSPDGSLILLLAFETTAKKNPETGQYYRGSKALVAIMPADGGDLEILAEGEVYCRPYFWSADGESIYYAGCGEQDYRLTRMDLATRAAQVVGTQSLGGVLGRMPGREWVADHVGDGRIAWYNIESGQPVFVGAWSVPGVKFVGGKKFELHGFDWSRSGAVLLWYDDGRSERFEVVRFPAILPIPPPPHEVPGVGHVQGAGWKPLHG